jgi:hypothetical protein
MRRVALLILIFLAQLIFISGCAFYPKEKYAHYSIEQLSHPDFKPSIDYEIQITSTYGSDETWYAMYTWPTFDNMLRQSNYFSKCTPGLGSADYHLSFKMIVGTDDSRVLNLIPCTVTFLTLTIIPCHLTKKSVLMVDVYKNKLLVKKYKYEREYSLWIQLFLILHSNPPEIRATNGIWIDMMMEFLHDIGQEKIFY